MTGKDRKRQLARERYEKRMAARAVAREKARRRTAMGLSAGAVIAIVAIVLAFVLPSNKKSAATASSPSAAASAGASPAASAVPPVATTASGCTSKLSTVASPVAGFPSLPPGASAVLKTEPIVTIPAGPVPTTTQVKDIVVGTGKTAALTDTVTVNYLGISYTDCSEFDSSWSRAAAAPFPLNQVIPGFTKGIGGDTATGIAPMKVGGRREIIVPPPDGYGTTGSGAVKPNEELVFVVDLLATAPAASSASPSAATS